MNRQICLVEDELSPLDFFTNARYDQTMKKQITTALAFGLVLVASVAFASGATLVNGSVGQRSNDNTTFGVSVCNNGSAVSGGSVPISVTANGVTTIGQSANAINPGDCDYTYFPYATFSMQNGQTYTVQISVNGAADSSYSVTVPGGVVLGASITAPSQNQINLLATEYRVMQQLITLLQKALGRN